MVRVLPDLIALVHGVPLPVPVEDLKQPFLPALLGMLADRFDQSLAREALEVAKNVGDQAFLRSSDQVDMARHDHETVQAKSFVLPTEDQIVQDQLGIALSREQ